MFRRILVAVDGSDAARAAFVFVTDWTRQFDARVWIIRPAETSLVSGATRNARNLQLVSAISEAAQTYQADLIVLGFEPRRLAHHLFTRGVRERLTEATDLPVLVAAPPQSAPSRVAARAETRPPRKAIALGAAAAAWLAA
jgi:nucleotide-binding universal stress UspA family protein